MSGRPVITPAWALETVFPGTVGSTPWAAQPCKVQPSGDLWTPNTKPPAEQMNWLFNKLGTDLANTLAFAGNGPGLDWRPIVPATTLLPSPSNAVYTCASWDPVLRQWILGGMSAADGSGSARVHRAENGGWDGSLALAPNVSSGATGVVPFAAGYDGSGTKYLVAGLNSAHVFAGNCSPGGAWALGYTDASATFVSTSLHQMGGQIFLAYSKATQTLLYYSTDHGTTFNNTTYALGGYTGGVGEIMVDNGTTLLVIACANTSHYLYGTSGALAWNTGNVPWGTDVPMGATYSVDQNGPCFYVVTAPGGGGMNTWKSADGVNWSQVGGLLVTFAPTSLASLGSILVASSGVSGGIVSAYFSVDFGVTWRLGVNAALPDSTPYAGLRPVVAASDTQFMFLWQVDARVSGPAGLPPAVA